MDLRTLTPKRLAMLLLIAGLALGLGLSYAQTQAGRPSTGDNPKTVTQPADEPKAAPGADTPQTAAAGADPAASAPDEKATDEKTTDEDAAAQVAAAEEAQMSLVRLRTLSGMRRTTAADRKAAAVRAKSRREALRRANPNASPLGAVASCAGVPLGTPCGRVDYFGIIPNWANSKLPKMTLTSAPGVVPQTYSVTPGTGIRKFVDTLPGLGPANKNNLGAYIPIATPFATPPVGVPNDGDYYEIGLVDFKTQFNSDLPGYCNTHACTSSTVLPDPSAAGAVGTQVRGYRDLNPAAGNATLPGHIGAYAEDNYAHYLGPVILAKTNRPVRVKFTNQLVPNSKFFIPVDTSIPGAGNGPDGTPYSHNVATLHLHGGATPWISDGTPHQWTVPAPQGSNVEATNFKTGVSTRYVPDMWYDPVTHASVPAGTAGAVNDPGEGSMTFYYTNEQSDRLMFYHDHALGITRLNVYAGEAAGYLLHDGPGTAGAPTLDDLIGPNGTIPDNGGGVYTYGIPLIVQDKTFVPPATDNSSVFDPGLAQYFGTQGQLGAQDPTWNWGPEGNLWFPHVYMTNQSPNNPDDSGANAMGRWDLGAWFWPVMTSTDVLHPPVVCGSDSVSKLTAGYAPGSMCPSTPNPSLTPESFMDTPVINGTAYPVVNLEPKAYRFRILNASNDRMWNFSIFYAADKDGNVCNPTYNGFNNLGLAQAFPGDPATCTEVKMVPALTRKLSMGVNVSPTNPGGLPVGDNDPDDVLPLCASTAGNPDVNVGSAFLITANPGAVDYNPATGLPGLQKGCWPSTWPMDGRDGGVPDPTTAGPPWVQIGTEGGVLPAAVVIPATPINYNYNRRDIVVTNVQEHGLFLGPAERADVIVDFSAVPPGATLMLYSDAPTPVPGFDPRTDYYTGNPDLTDTGGAPSTQPGYGPNTRTLMQIRIAGSPVQWTGLSALKSAIPGIFKSTQPTIIVPQDTYSATALGVPSAPTKGTYSKIQSTSLTFTPIVGGTLAPAITMPMQPKAIHELFENDYGKMNSVLAMELPNTNFTNQTTLPLAYVDPPSEFISNGETQIWKVTHNGVDSHAMHFHLFDVQVINRVGWDGAIRPPDPNELGWKETVRMNPLEDAIVALRPTAMTFPFAIGESSRLYDPTRPEGAFNAVGRPGFSNLDPLTGNAVSTINTYANYGWEYVWHCHLLGHEENDMMRPIVFKVASPASPFNLKAVGAGTTTSPLVNLSWSYTEGATDATDMQVQRRTGTGPFGNIGALIPIPASSTPGTTTNYTYQDASVVPGTTYSYQVVSQGVMLSAPSNIATITLPVPLAAPTNLTAPSVSTTQAILSWTAPVPATGVTGYTIQRAPNVGTAAAPVAGTFANVGTSTTTTFRNTGLVTKTTYFYRVQATGGGVVSAYSPTLKITTP